jgi:hypothetical protein
MNKYISITYQNEHTINTIRLLHYVGIDKIELCFYIKNSNTRVYIETRRLTSEIYPFGFEAHGGELIGCRGTEVDFKNCAYDTITKTTRMSPSNFDELVQTDPIFLL